MPTRSRSVFLALCGAMAGAAFAAPEAELSGVVVDQDRRALAGVDISLARSGRTTRTDARGAWTLSTASGTRSRLTESVATSKRLVVASGRISVRAGGTDLAGRAGEGSERGAAFGARRTESPADTLLVELGSRVRRVPLASTTSGAMDTIVLHTDTATANGLELRTTRYPWIDRMGLGLGLVNSGTEDFDSLRIRLFLNGKKSQLLDFAARIDIAFRYGANGYADTGLFAATNEVQKARPRLLDAHCLADSGCAWAFDMPFVGARLEKGARWRLDILFDRHNLIRDSIEILNQPPTHDPFAGGDWSFRAHVAGGDGGVSERDYAGVPQMSKNAIDSLGSEAPVNPYIAVYRGDRLLYGNPP